MDKRKKNITLLVILLAIGSILGLVYWLWVKSIALPILGELNTYEAETVEGKNFAIQDGKIKLISFAESDCPEDCEQLFTRLEEVQNKLIKDKNFASRVEMLTVAENQQMDKHTFEQYKEKYNIDEKGWKLLIIPSEQLDLFKNQINDSKENDRMVTLVDAKRKVRQHYQLKNKEEQEQLIKDINQLIRIQQQSIEERR